MEKHIVQFFKFLEDKESKSIPLKLKFLYPEIFGKHTKEQLKVKGDLNLSSTNIKELPQGLQVGGSLWLSGCRSLTNLPEELKVGGSLILSGCRSLTELPQGLKVSGSLFLVKTPIVQKYSKEQIRSMVEDGGGFVEHEIIT